MHATALGTTQEQRRRAATLAVGLVRFILAVGVAVTAPRRRDAVAVAARELFRIAGRRHRARPAVGGEHQSDRARASATRRSAGPERDAEVAAAGGVVPAARTPQHLRRRVEPLRDDDVGQPRLAGEQSLATTSRRLVDALQCAVDRRPVGPVQVIREHAHARRTPDLGVHRGASMSAVEVAGLDALQGQVGPVDPAQVRVDGDGTEVADVRAE